MLNFTKGQEEWKPALRYQAKLWKARAVMCAEEGVLSEDLGYD